MATLKDLQKYLGYEFSSGEYVGKDYTTFQTKYINYIKAICKENNWELARTIKGHYEFSLFIRNKDNRYIYLSICDVRYFDDEWYNNILIRTAKSDADYLGGFNHYTSLPELETNIKKLFIKE